MNLSEKLMTQGGKPSGLLGRLIGNLMNLSHKSIYRWGLGGISLGSSSAALDIGCGGGKVVKMLATKMPGGKVYGIDHSLEMVNLSKRVNRSLIGNDRVEINHGSVSSLPYTDNMFDIVTAFETIQFWPNLNEDLREVKRVLKPLGQLLVVNRYPDLEGQNSSWAEVLQIHSSEEYRERLSDASYVDISIDDSSKHGWILVSARKP
ncbi:MAG TPA: class I SAM-dependent methyltransferase [Phycisphaerae bacterium]|nr:class I SAM-dependent methyltransferase [Phycisphaerae bacterium]